jgi:hypothetical protein
MQQFLYPVQHGTTSDQKRKGWKIKSRELKAKVLGVSFGARAPKRANIMYTQ